MFLEKEFKFISELGIIFVALKTAHGRINNHHVYYQHHHVQWHTFGVRCRGAEPGAELWCHTRLHQGRTRYYHTRPGQRSACMHQTMRRSVTCLFKRKSKPQTLTPRCRLNYSYTRSAPPPQACSRRAARRTYCLTHLGQWCGAAWCGAASGESGRGRHHVRRDGRGC